MAQSGPLAGQNIHGVQYLRALAAILVVYFHTTVYTSAFAWPDSLSRDFGEGGVDLFFVISGFIMMTVTARSPMTPGQFLLRRIVRIVPLYWLVTLIILAVGLIYPAAMLNNVVTVDHVILSMLFIPHANPLTGAITPFFKLGWTLNYEMYFYLIFAVLLLVLSTPRARLIALVAYATVISTIFLIIDPQIAIVRVYTNPIIFEFVMGAAVGYLFITDRLSRLPPVLCGVIILAALAAMLSVRPDDEIRTQVHGVASAFLLVAFLALEIQGRLRRVPLLCLLGDASYSIYLVHPLVQSVARIGAKMLHLPVETPAVGAILVVTATIGAVIGGVIAYLLVEKPLLALLRPYVDRKPKRTAAPAAA